MGSLGSTNNCLDCKNDKNRLARLANNHYCNTITDTFNCRVCLCTKGLIKRHSSGFGTKRNKIE